MREEIVDQADVHAFHDQRYTEQHAEDDTRPVLREELLPGQVELFLVSRRAREDELGLAAVGWDMFAVLDSCGLLSRLQAGGVVVVRHRNGLQVTGSEERARLSSEDRRQE